MSLQYQIVISEFGLNALGVSFDGEQFEFDLTELYKDTTHLKTLYDKINEYVATLAHERQSAIFEVYRRYVLSELKGSFEEPSSVHQLELMIAEVSTLLDYNAFIAWTHSQSHLILYPDNLPEEYVDDPDQNTPPEKTYTRKDYTDLIGKVLFIRALSPLYIDYYNYIKNISNCFYYKLFMLLVRSDVYTSRQAEKLRIYVEANRTTFMGGQAKNDNLVIDAGLSDEDVLDALLGEVIFNKLLTIDFFHKKCNIISFVFQTIKYKGSYTPSDGMIIRNKSAKSADTKDDISYFEDYRKTSNIVLGASVEFQHALSSLDFLLTGLGRTHFNHAAYQYELDHHLAPLLEKKVDKTQIYVLGWFLDKIINPRALYYIEPRKLVELMLFAKVIFLEDGHHFMALFMSSFKAEDSDLMNVVIKNTISKNVVRKLHASYGFVMEEDKISVIEKTLSEISKEIFNSRWIPIATKEQIALVGQNAGALMIPSNLNEVFYNYTAYLNGVNTAPETA